MTAGRFRILHNREPALRQEYRLARQDYDAACARLTFSQTAQERFRAARERLDQAARLLHA